MAWERYRLREYIRDAQNDLRATYDWCVQVVLTALHRASEEGSFLRNLRAIALICSPPLQVPLAAEDRVPAGTRGAGCAAPAVPPASA